MYLRYALWEKANGLFMYETNFLNLSFCLEFLLSFKIAGKQTFLYFAINKATLLFNITCKLPTCLDGAETLL